MSSSFSPPFNPSFSASNGSSDADKTFANVRMPPHSQESEQAVLGGLMLDHLALEKVSDILQSEDFYRVDHRHIYTAITGLSEGSKPFDAVMVAEWLSKRELLEEAGGVSYLAELVEAVPTAANIAAYALMIRESSVLRKLIDVGTQIAQMGYRPEGRAATEVLDYAEREIFAIADEGERVQRGFRPIKDLMTGAMDRIAELFEREDAITGNATGFKDFDEMTSGLQAGDLVIVAGRPSMGKTTFAMNIAEHIAISGRKGVAVFSMEMPGEQLALRMLSSIGRVDQTKVRTGRLDDHDWHRLTSAVGILSQTEIHIDDTPALSPSDLRSRARRLARTCNLGVIVVDYLQLMQVPGTKENRTNEISEISRSLKAIAKELNVPVVALSQLNRSLEQRPNKRPVMSDLRESGAIEQDADVIVFIYRDEVYDKDSPHKGMAEIIIGKQRNGPIGSLILTFRGQNTRFEDYIPSDVMPEGYH
jgi:replicative DNA helicase